MYVFRGAWPALGVAARFCRRHSRKLVFAAASDLNFLPKSDTGLAKRVDYAVYRYGGRRTDAIVVQTGERATLARAMFPRAPRIVEIPSFAEPAAEATATPEAFLWSGRLDKIKNPGAYVALARAVPEGRFWMIPKFAHENPAEYERLRSAAATIPNLELVDSRPRDALMELVDRSVAIVNTSPCEGMPNMFLEGWALWHSGAHAGIRPRQADCGHGPRRRGRRLAGVLCGGGAPAVARARRAEGAVVARALLH